MAKEKTLQVQMNEILEDFFEVVRDGYEGAEKDVAEECVRRLKSVKWKTKTGKNYSGTWSLKKQKKWGGYIGGYTVHNTKNYRLTHLLENGHDVVNQTGDTGKRYEGKKHIEPVYLWAKEELEREIRQRIERGIGI